jgi:hypothetical protein
MLSAASCTVSSILFCRVSVFFAFIIHSKIPLFDERGNFSQLSCAVLLFKNNAFKSSGMVIFSTSSNAVQVPFCLAISIIYNPEL